MKSTNNIKCPSCDHEFNVEEAIARKVELGFEASLKAKEEEMKKDFQAKIEKLNEREGRIKNAELEQQELIKQLVSEKEAELKQQLTAQLGSDFEAKLKALESDNVAKNEQLANLRKKEVELLRKEAKMQEEKESLDLIYQKKLMAEREQIKEQFNASYEEKKALEMQEKDILINQLKERIDDMKKKTDQGSMQVQGEAQELMLENLLAEKFPFDIISEVPKGVGGADCIQTIRNEQGLECGSIVFESKRTKSFSNSWLAKLKQDTLKVKGKIPVLVTEVLPEGIKGMGQLEGVWITDFANVSSLVMILRFAVLKEYQALESQVNKGDKMQMLYDYLTGDEFSMQMQTIIEGFSGIKLNLDQQKRSMQANWKKQEKELEKVIESTIHMYGSVRGIAGSAFKQIASLELLD